MAPSARAGTGKEACMNAQLQNTPAPPTTRNGRLRQGWFESLLDETHFIQRYPHYAAIVARLVPIATNSVPVMAICLRRWDDSGSTFQLLVNVEYFAKNPQYWTGVLLHEIQHVLLGHLTEAKFHYVSYPLAMELAAEISANEFIQEPLPEGVIMLNMFSKFGIRPGQSTMERYVLLREACRSGRLKIWKIEDQTVDTHRPCQSGSGSGGAGLGDMLDARSDGATEKNWRRKPLLLGRKSSEATLQRMKEMIAAHLQGEHGGADDPLQDDKLRRGKELSRTLVDTGPRGQLNWARVLREAFPQRRRIQPTYLKPNRRFPKRVGEIPGRQRRPPKPKIIVGIDTSGSMNGEALGRIAKEIRRLAQQATLTLVECDAAIHRIYAMAGPLGPFTGGGDTNFVPVFDEARSGARKFEGLIYFTDGKGNLPRTAPAVPTLWVLIHQDPFYPKWGKIVRLPE
jgi:predicted metal-dependent peptidase